MLKMWLTKFIRFLLHQSRKKISSQHGKRIHISCARDFRVHKHGVNNIKQIFWNPAAPLPLWRYSLSFSLHFGFYLYLFFSYLFFHGHFNCFLYLTSILTFMFVFISFFFIVISISPYMSLSLSLSFYYYSFLTVSLDSCITISFILMRCNSPCRRIYLSTTMQNSIFVS